MNPKKSGHYFCDRCDDLAFGRFCQTCHQPARWVPHGRVSTDKQGQSIELQRSELCRYCELKGLPPPQLFMDSDTSGSIPFADRESAGQLLQDCLTGKYRHLVVSKIDRLGRDAMDVQTVIKLLGQADVTVHIIDLGGSSFDTRSPINGMIIAVLAWAAQMMRDTIRSNVNAGLNHKRSKNELTGTVPFGWDAVETGEVRRNKGGKDIKIRRLMDNLEEQKWILRVWHWRFERAWSYQAIANELNRNGVPTKRAGETLKLRSPDETTSIRETLGRWQAGNVAKVLANQSVQRWLKTIQ